eukprot:g6519.t1
MKVSKDRRLSWLQLWQAMDTDRSNLLDYAEFIQACGLSDNMWSWRMYNLLDTNFVGCVDFLTFFRSLPRYLVFDRANAVEVAFRLCSRRGATWDPDQSVLDEKDIRLFVEERYPTLDRKHTLHRALEILAHMDNDCSGGVSFDEFKQNPVFLTAVQHTLQSMRNAIFGEKFWEDFTKAARTFDKVTKSEIFCSQTDFGDDDPDAGGFAAAATKRVTAATKRQFQTIASAAVSKKRQKLDDVSSLMNATAGKFRKIASESNLGRHLASKENGPSTAAMTGKVSMEKLRLWTTSAPSSAADKARSLTARAGEARTTLRRIVSDPNLRTLGESKRAMELSVRSAGKQASQRLADSARGVSHGGSMILQMSARKMDKTRDVLKNESQRLTVVARDAAKGMGKVGRLKVTATVSVAIHRMRALAEAAKQEREATAQQAPTLSNASAASLVCTLPRHLPYAETGKRSSEAAKVGGGRALAALKRAVRVIAAARYFSEAGKRSQGFHQEREAGATNSARRSVKECEGGERDDEHEDVQIGESVHSEGSDSARDQLNKEGGEEEEEEEEAGNPWETLTGAKAKAKVKLFQERHWAVTEIFYSNLAAATERLESTRTQERGYDFSADFPRVWCEAHMRGSQGERKTKYRRKRLSSATKRAANVYLRFVYAWQGSGDDSGRSKLTAAFQRWRLNTCDAAVDGLSGSLSTPSRGGTATTAGELDFAAEEFTHVPRHTQSLEEMWEASGGESRLHDIVISKARGDRPLPWELCETYEREMIERIDRRQAENNVPILPFAIC